MTKKRKKKEKRISWIEVLFGYPVYMWFNMTFFPRKVPDEVDLFLHEKIKVKGKEQEKVKLQKYFLNPSGLWLPSNR